ncbi:PAS domain-containing protein [Rufibacter aurantiacus]|uniref:PAS domain-containing protein n=1 Tax=Rufibacter aurantiacus TaxID=2817374 RepID=UPI001B311B7D|nr:PAS domain-containing protein [Rufibacter aurantiacus]
MHSTPDFSLNLPQVFEALPDCYLVLSADFVIQGVTESYLTSTFTSREQLVGNSFFEVFTGQEGQQEAAILRHLKQSFDRVLKTKKPDSMPVQHFNLKDPERPNLKLERYWKSLNTPVLDDKGEVLYILHRVEDVTKIVRQSHKLENLTRQEEDTKAIANESQLLWYIEQEKVKRAYEKLEEEHRRFKEAQALGHIGSFERNYSEQTLNCSDEFYRIYGLEPQSEEITTDKIIAFSHPEEREILRERIWQAQIFLEPLELTHRIIWRNGTIRYVHRRAVLTPDAQGKPLKVYGTIQDITSQVMAQEKVQASEALLRKAEAIGQTGSYEGDLTTRKFRFSDNMYQLLGLQPQSLVPDLDFIDSISHPEDVAQVREIIGKAVQSKKPYQYTRRIYRPDGEMRYLLSNGKVVCDEAGNAIKIVGTAQDITEKKRAEEEIKETKDLLEATFNASVNGIEVFQAVRNDAGEIIDFEWLLVNHTTERYAGRTDLKGHKWLATYPKLRQTGMFHQCRKVVETGQVLDYEHFDQYKDFAAWFQTMGVPYRDGLILTWTDITNRKKAEAELTQKAELLQTIVDTAFGGMELLAAIRDHEGKIIDFRYLMVNTVQARYANISREKMVGNTVLAFFPSIKSTGAWECLLRVMETGETIQQLEEYHADGVEGWFDQHYEKINDGILVWNVDVTPIKKAEIERRESEERTWKFIDSLPQMAWTAAVNGGSTYYNQKTYDYTGLTFEQMKEYGWEQIYQEAERAQVEQEWKTAIASGKEYRKQSLMRRWDGAYRWQLVIAQPVKDHAGNITSWAGTVTDIHERVIAEQELQENRQLLKAVIDASINGIQAFRAIRDEENQLIDFEWILTNQVTDTFLQKNDLLGKRLTDKYPGTKPVGIFDKMKQVNETGKTAHFEVWYPYDALHHWFQFIVVKMGDGVVLTFQDITERKKLEEQRLQWELQKQQELLHAILETEEREKKRIAENLHNGLGQVLFAVKMQLDLLNPEESVKSAAQTKAFWQRTDQLLTNAIELTQTISHELTPTVLETFGLSAVLVDICKQLSTKNLKVHCKIDFKSVLEKHLQTAIYRIVQELLNNIVKHAHATNASITVLEEKSGILILAQDNGKGFKAKPLPGKGMGLIGIGDRVKLLNGTLQIQSTGPGTTITIKLPLKNNHPGVRKTEVVL